MKRLGIVSRLSIWLATRLAVVTMAAVLIGAPALAIDEPGKPFLQKVGFDLASAGFRVKFANDPASQKAFARLAAVPFCHPHR